MVETRRSSSSSKRPLSAPLPSGKRSKGAQASSSTHRPACTAPAETLGAANDSGCESPSQEVRSPDPPCGGGLKSPDGANAAVLEKSSDVEGEGEALVSPRSLGDSTLAAEKTKAAASARPKKRQLKSNFKVAGGKLLSQCTQEIYERLSMEASEGSVGTGESSSPAIDEHRLFYQAVSSKNKKGRVYGLGSQGNRSYSTRVDNSSNTSFGSGSGDIEQMKLQFNQMREEIRQLNENIQQIKEENQQLRQCQQEILVWQEHMNRFVAGLLKQSTAVVGPSTDPVGGDPPYNDEDDEGGDYDEDDEGGDYDEEQVVNPDNDDD